MFHSLVILAHFPLVNIPMPPNAGIVFQNIMKVATFDIVDTDPLVDYLESTFGLTWKESAALNSSFDEMGYETLDPMRNLQLMFVALVALLLIPILLKMVLVIVYCCKPLRKGVNWLERKLYFNYYIRFILEAYLEFSIAAIITISKPQRMIDLWNSAMNNFSKARRLL